MMMMVVVRKLSYTMPIHHFMESNHGMTGKQPWNDWVYVKYCITNHNGNEAFHKVAHLLGL